MPERKMLISCAFTGHRPMRFAFGDNESAPLCIQLKKSLEQQILRLYKRGIRKFFTGCALGVDMWAGESIISLKEQYPDLELFCVVPFKGQEANWELKQQKRYHEMLEKSDSVVTLNKEYTRGCYFARNRFLVDKADVLLAVYNRNEKQSGAGYTVDYAIKQQKSIILIDPDTLRLYVHVANL